MRPVMVMEKKILLVDDDELVLSSLDLFLSHEDFKTRMVARAALIDEAISDFRPDLIVMDIWLDTADGRIICDRLKSGADTSDIPIILFTGLSYDQIALVDCHADAIIGKSYDNGSLLNTINQLLGQETV